MLVCQRWRQPRWTTKSRRARRQSMKTGSLGALTVKRNLYGRARYCPDEMRPALPGRAPALDPTPYRHAGLQRDRHDTSTGIYQTGGAGSPIIKPDSWSWSRAFQRAAAADRVGENLADQADGGTGQVADGQILMDGQDVTKLRTAEAQYRLVHQFFVNYPHMTCLKT